MVKHQKEKLYPSAREHRAVSQLRKNGGSSEVGLSVSRDSKVRRLPFDCCALSLTPYQIPVCNGQGIIFDSSSILPHVSKYNSDPITGEPMTSRDIIRLHMDKDERTGRWQCPVRNKPFADHTKIVAIRQRHSASNADVDGIEANVFSFEAVEELNLKPRNYVDLISGLKFRKDRDIIWLNDPENEELNRKREEASYLAQQQLKKLMLQHPQDNPNIRHSLTAQRILEQLSNNKRKGTTQQQSEGVTNSMLEEGKKLKLFHGSVSIDEVSPESKEASMFDAMKRYKKKGYVNIHTNKGTLFVELHCDIVPRTTYNFLGLASKGAYDGSLFHRCIRNFMIQGGKPANGKGEGKSLWGSPFSDEFDNRLKHDGRGILSMANSGPNTNGSQFFITFKSCGTFFLMYRYAQKKTPLDRVLFLIFFFLPTMIAVHLDKKHSVFGHVIKGLEYLQVMEDTLTDKDDRPIDPIRIVTIEILSNPTEEAVETENVRKRELEEEKSRLQESRKASALGGMRSKSSGEEQGESLKSHTKDQDSIILPITDGTRSVGLYLKRALIPNLQTGEKKAKGKDNLQNDSTAPDEFITAVPSMLPPPPKKTVFKDFSAW
jgi:peptidyl-prolyl cis-trans isomerase-like protein 2